MIADCDAGPNAYYSYFRSEVVDGGHIIYDFARQCCDGDPSFFQTFGLGHWSPSSPQPSCPNKVDLLFTEEFDSDLDGKVDRCYNPADKIKKRTRVSDNICWKEGAAIVWTPSSKDEDKIKAAAREALNALNALDYDMKNPDIAINKSKLDVIAKSFSLVGYQDPNFNIIAGLISKEASCIRPKLEAIIDDPQGNNIRVNSYEFGFNGVNCKKLVGSDLVDFTELSKKIFTAYRERLSPTISHEVHHRCNGRDDLTNNGLGLSEAIINKEKQKFLQQAVKAFKSSILNDDPIEVKKYFARAFITNAYVFDNILKVYR